jgi:uncharacterized membrane protein YbhN (UPF0104 family)
VLRVGAAVGALALVLWAATQVDWRALWVSLRDLDVGVWLIAVAVGAVIKLGAKIGRSHALVVAVARARGVTPPPLRATARLFASTHAIGQLLWPPVGMSLRTVGLVRDGLSVAAAAEIQVGERIAEAVALAAMAGVMAIAAPGALTRLFGSAGWWILLGLVAVIAVVTVSARSSRRVRRAWTTGWQPLAVASGFALLSHIGDVVILMLVAHAAHVPVDLPAILVAFVAVNSAAVIPLVPGQLGVLEAAVVFGLAYGGVAAAPALAVALAYRAAYLVPLVVLGLPSALFESLGRRVDCLRSPGPAL